MTAFEATSDHGGDRVTGISAGQPAGQAAGKKAKLVRVEMEDDTDALYLAADWADISQGLRKDLVQQLHNQWINPIHMGSY